MKKQNKKSAREKRVLTASIAVASVILAGSTFAWFTSTDEVTNRLSASAEYGVAIAESFQPPENWVPGQEINKDAGAVNTGNVDAFVRMYLDGSMRLLQQNKSTALDSAKVMTTSYTAPTTAVTDVNLLNANLTYQDTQGNYFRTLDKTQTKNPKTSISTNNDGYATNVSGAYSEVQAMQSGILAYAPSGAKYSYVLKEETELKVNLTSNVNGTSTTEYKSVQVPAGTLVIVGATAGDVKPATLDANGILTPDTTSVTVTSTSGATKAYTSTVYVEAQSTGDTFFTPQNVEYESFTPMTAGLYLFLRNEKDADQTEPEFSGYYMATAPTNATDGTAYNAVNFFALNTNTGSTSNRSDYTVKGKEGGDGVTFDKETPIKVTYDNAKKNIVKVEPQATLELFNAQYQTIDASKLKFYADAVVTTGDDANTQTIYAVYDADANTTFDKDKDIVIVITTANVVSAVGDNAETWTSIGTTNATTAYTLKTGTTVNLDATNLKFYYNNDVEAGDSTVKLVDKVKLYEGVTNKAYLAFDFDLNVHLGSVQVTFDENGKELDTAVSASGGAEWKGTATDGGATGARDTGSGATNEIAKITWTATTT